MAVQCPVELDQGKLQLEVSRIYAQVAENPEAGFHFHRGPHYAAEHLGYDSRELAELPEKATASFAGVGNPLAIGEVHAGETVLDVGCGAGMDLLLAARRVGPEGRAIGVDMTDEMVRKAQSEAAALGLANVDVRRGRAEALPVEGASVDVVISNGVLNLSPDKLSCFSEIHRVLRPGGRLLLADIVVAEELSEDIRRNVDLWTG